MHTHRSRESLDVVIDATDWLMQRYQHTRCARVAALVEQHLNWIADRASEPRLADAHRRLRRKRHLATTLGARPTLH